MKDNEILDMGEVLRLRNELKGWTEYIPLLLINFIDADDYFKNLSSDANKEYINRRQNLPKSNDELNEYLYRDILEWVNKYPQFNKILLKK